MNRYKQSLLAFWVITQLCGCGGENFTVQQPEPELKTVSPITHYQLQQMYSYDANELVMGDAPQVSESRRYGQETASFFSYARDLRVSRISWNGHVENNQSLLDGKGTFILRFYQLSDTSPYPMRLPDKTPLSEYRIAAEAHLIGPSATGYWYQFVYSDYAMFAQSAGNYWVSVMDPETEGMNFSWVVAPTTNPNLTNNKHSHRDLGGNWISSMEGDYLNAMSIKLEGGPPVSN